MTKIDFAELKEKLCRKQYVDIYVQREHDAAIITELIEIIQSQSEALDNLIGHVDASLLFPHKDRIDLFKAEQESKQALSETTTRLQKLREGK